MSVLFNGKIHTGPLPIQGNDRGLLYGDGFFETLVTDKGKIYFESLHWERMKRTAEALQLDMPRDLNPSSIHEQVKNLLEDNGLYQKARLRITIWRKEGGLFTPNTKASHYFIRADAFNIERVVKDKVGFSQTCYIYPHRLSAFKTINCLPYVHAGMEKEARGLDELILLNEQGEICEASSSNVFWYARNAFFTPSLETGCISGVRREALLNLLKRQKKTVMEGRFQKEELLQAEYIFTSNVMGLFPILSLEGQRFASPNLSSLNVG